MTEIPSHYDKPVTPWDLQRHMETSGNLFVDARRTDAIEYAFRNKDDMEKDLRKAAHCLLEAAAELKRLKKPLFTGIATVEIERPVGGYICGKCKKFVPDGFPCPCQLRTPDE